MEFEIVFFVFEDYKNAFNVIWTFETNSFSVPQFHKVIGMHFKRAAAFFNAHN